MPDRQRRNLLLAAALLLALPLVLGPGALGGLLGAGAGGRRTEPGGDRQPRRPRPIRPVDSVARQP